MYTANSANNNARNSPGPISLPRWYDNLWRDQRRKWHYMATNLTNGLPHNPREEVEEEGSTSR